MRTDIKVELLCKDSEGKVFSYGYTDVMEGTEEDKHGRYSQELVDTITKAILKVGQEYPKTNVEVIHCYKVKEW